MEFETCATRHRFDFQHHVAELAMAAGLLLVPAALGDLFADGLLIADRRRVRFDVDAEPVAQALLRDAQMHLALPPQYDVVGALVLDHGQRGIFLVEPQQRLAELHVVLAIACGDRDRQHRRHRLDLCHGCWRGLAVRERITGLDRIELAERDGLAGFRRGALGIVGAADGENAGNPPRSAGGSLQRRAVVEMPGEQSRQRQLAAVLQMHGLEHVGERLLG